MSDLEYFSEESYDEASGEYSGSFDFEPDFASRVYLNEAQTLWVDVSGLAGTEAEYLRVFDVLGEAISKDSFEPDFDENNPENYPYVPPEFDYQGDNIRGPIIGAEQLEKWLDQSGLRNTAKVYYDEVNDEYWIDVDTN